MNIKGSGACAFGCETRNNWFGTVRGRVGYAWDRVMVYGTGGYAFDGAEPIARPGSRRIYSNTGIELAADRKNVLVQGLTLSASVTYVDSTTLSDPGFASATGTTAAGKRVPYVPDWRATMEATWIGVKAP